MGFIHHIYLANSQIQEIALYESFTILEIFSYYGLLHSLSEDGIRSKLEELQILLNLPNFDKYVNEMR